MCFVWQTFRICPHLRACGEWSQGKTHFPGIISSCVLRKCLAARVPCVTGKRSFPKLLRKIMCSVMRHKKWHQVSRTSVLTSLQHSRKLDQESRLSCQMFSGTAAPTMMDGWLAGQAGGRLDPGLSHPLASAFQRSLHSGRHPIRFAFSVNPADSRRRHPPANFRGPVTIECPLPMDILCGLLSNSFEHLPSCWVCGLKPTNTQSWRRQNGDMLLILLVFHSET